MTDYVINRVPTPPFPTSPQYAGAVCPAIYDQGWNEARGGDASRERSDNPACSTCPPRDLLPPGYADMMKERKRFQANPDSDEEGLPIATGRYLGNPGPKLPDWFPGQRGGGFSAPAFGYNAPLTGPQLPAGVPTYYPAYGPPTLGLPACRSSYDCNSDEYCHEGICLTSPWESHVGVTVDQPRYPNPHPGARSPTVIAFAGRPGGKLILQGPAEAQTNAARFGIGVGRAGFSNPARSKERKTPWYRRVVGFFKAPTPA